MKRLLQWILLAVLLLSATSCGIPQLLGRTANNTIQKVGAFANSAAY